MDAGAARGARNIPSRTAFVLLLLASRRRYQGAGA